MPTLIFTEYHLRACGSLQSMDPMAALIWLISNSPKAILEGQPIDVYNNGIMQRDFTYIDDIVEGIVRLMPKAAKRAETRHVRCRSAL